MNQNIIDTAKAAGTFKTFGTAIAAAGLTETLNGPGPFTVFAPTDDAFAKIPKASLDALLGDQPKLKQLLLSHVVHGRLDASAVMKMKDGDKVKTASTSDLVVGHKGQAVTVDKSKVTMTDINASNGVIHEIDAVLLKS